MNLLAGEKSPYLLQHARNPVAWHSWGEEAFARARREDKPIFLSIGYSTCHWCHVMEREVFENRQVADLMNEAFVSIKVDREERPDLDEHYMTVSQMLTGSGGWPLTIVMTPDGEPFFAATYIPRENAYGRLGMLELVPRLAEVWRTRRAEVLSSARSAAAQVGRIAATPASGAAFDAGSIAAAEKALAASFDAKHGGFGAAPKFPMATVYPFLLRAWRRSANPDTLAMVEKTLKAMRNGGVYDQIGFGFHRYSTDERWLVPHFEKMLYDQALLALAYTEAWQATGSEFFRATAREILAYVLRDMRSPEGAFYSAEDADSEGEEGRFYLWSAEEIRGILGDEASAAFIRTYGVSEAGNYGESDGANILHRAPDDTSAPAALEAALLAARGQRVRPFRDDTVLTDWNGLAIAALARAAAAFDDPPLAAAARRAADFLLERMRGGDGRLRHRLRGDAADVPSFADDYAFLSWGLLEVYGATFDARYLRQAVDLVEEFTAHFWDAAGGGFFQTADDAADPRTVRRKPIPDGVLPSANSAGLMVLARLADITGRQDFRQKAERIAGLYPHNVPAASVSFAAFLAGLDYLVGPSFQVVVAGDPLAADTRAMLRALRERYLPRATVLFRPTDVAEPPVVNLAPFTASQTGLDGRATAYVCRGGACRLPTTDIRTMLEQLAES